eukprot:SAG11_NODE_440_length_9448_cov_3.356509_11_plen_85_part_00
MVRRTFAERQVGQDLAVTEYIHGDVVVRVSQVERWLTAVKISRFKLVKKTDFTSKNLCKIHSKIIRLTGTLKKCWLNSKIPRYR